MQHHIQVLKIQIQNTSVLVKTQKRTTPQHALRPKRGKRHENQSETSRDIPDPNRRHRRHQVRRYTIPSITKVPSGKRTPAKPSRWTEGSRNKTNPNLIYQCDHAHGGTPEINHSAEIGTPYPTTGWDPPPPPNNKTHGMTTSYTNKYIITVK